MFEDDYTEENFQNFLKTDFVPETKVGGWLQDREAFCLYLMGKECAQFKGNAVELGSYEGRSAIHFCKGANRLAHLTCIDNWNYPAGCGLDPDTLEKKFKPNLREYLNPTTQPYERTTWDYLIACSYIIADTAEAINEYPKTVSLDGLFIDAGHYRWELEKDFNTWYPKVNPNGLILFHDYGNLDTWPDVEPYVNEQIEKGLILPIQKAITVMVTRKIN